MACSSTSFNRKEYNIKKGRAVVLIQLIIDSTCDLPKKVIEDNQVKIIPLRITIDNQSYADGLDISAEAVYESIKNNKDIKTSMPLYEDMYRLFHALAKQNTPFIYLSFSSKMSGSFNLANLVIEDLNGGFPDVLMQAIDSQSGSIATGLIALNAIENIKNKQSFEQIVSNINQDIQRVRHLFVVSSMDQLVKGGRVPKLVGRLGNQFKVRPILHVVDGNMKYLTQARGRKKAIEKIIYLLKQEVSTTDKIIGIAYSSSLDLVEEIKQELQTIFPDYQVFAVQIGSVLSVHIGLDAFGFFYFTDK